MSSDHAGESDSFPYYLADAILTEAKTAELGPNPTHPVAQKFSNILVWFVTSSK